MKIINRYIAPWVLPNQAFPIHCVWEPESSLSKIVINIPDDYALSDTLNFEKFQVEGRPKNIMIIDGSNLKSKNYFGVILKYPKIDIDIEKRDAVTIRFFNESNEILDSITLYTRIIRPKLELLDYPKEIEVTNGTNFRNLITLEILHRGFGTANLGIEVMHSGSDISKTDSLYFDVLRETLEKVLTICNEPVNSQDFVKVDDNLIKEVADNLLEIPFQENLPFKIDKEQLEELKSIVRDETKREAVYRIVYSSLRPLLLAALLYYAERHPAEDIKLVDGKVVATIKDKVDELTIRITYFDSFENIYPPLTAKIKVFDKRNQEKIRDFDVPINIKWKKEILNLEESICQ